MPLIILLSIVTKNIIHPKNSPDLGEFRGEYFIGHHGYDSFLNILDTFSVWNNSDYYWYGQWDNKEIILL